MQTSSLRPSMMLSQSSFSFEADSKFRPAAAGLGRRSWRAGQIDLTEVFDCVRYDVFQKCGLKAGQGSTSSNRARMPSVRLEVFIDMKFCG